MSFTPTRSYPRSSIRRRRAVSIAFRVRFDRLSIVGSPMPIVHAQVSGHLAISVRENHAVLREQHRTFAASEADARSADRLRRRPGPRGNMQTSRQLRLLVLMVHVGASVGSLGAVSAFLVLAIAGFAA